jgi:putative transposase
MTMPANEAVDNARSEPRTRAELVLEGIALRHQIAVLRRSGIRRPRFRRWDRLFWILLSWWWPAWRESLLIVQPETVLRWRRNGWSAFWRYRSRGRWRGGRPKVSREVRGLIAQMARENFLWGAPRIHGELLMLGFTVSQDRIALPAVSRPPSETVVADFHSHSNERFRPAPKSRAGAFGHGILEPVEPR